MIVEPSAVEWLILGVQTTTMVMFAIVLYVQVKATRAATAAATAASESAAAARAQVRLRQPLVHGTVEAIPEWPDGVMLNIVNGGGSTAYRVHSMWTGSHTAKSRAGETWDWGAQGPVDLAPGSVRRQAFNLRKPLVNWNPPGAYDEFAGEARPPDDPAIKAWRWGLELSLTLTYQLDPGDPTRIRETVQRWMPLINPFGVINNWSESTGELDRDPSPTH